MDAETGAALSKLIGASPEVLKQSGLVLAAVLSTMVAVLGWFATSFAGWCVWYFTRFLKRRELLHAIRAEIAANLVSERSYDADRRDTILTKMRAIPARRYKFVPYAPVYADNPVFTQIKTDLTLLPSPVIGPAVAYYNNSNGLSAEINDYRSDAFSLLDKDRRIEVVQGVYDVTAAETVRTGDLALLKIGTAITRPVQLAGLTLLALLYAFYLISELNPVSAARTRFRQAVGWASSCAVSIPKTPAPPAGSLLHPISYSANSLVIQ